MDCGRRPHRPKICAQSDPSPSDNADFDRFRLIVPHLWELARKVQLSLIGSRQRAFHRAIDEPCALSLSPPKGGSKTRIFTFGVALHFFVAGNRRHFKLNMYVQHSKSQPTDDKTSLKWACPRHVTHFYTFSLHNISLERLKLETSNLVYMLIMASPSVRMTNCPWKGRGRYHVTSLVFGK